MPKLPDSGERSEFSTGAVRDASKGKGIPSQIPPDVMQMLACRFEDGAEKYGLNNWKKGIPTHKYIDSLLRHLWAVQKGRVDEDHIAAVVWNAVCLAQTIVWVDEGELPRELETHLYNAGEPSVPSVVSTMELTKEQNETLKAMNPYPPEGVTRTPTELEKSWINQEEMMARPSEREKKPEPTTLPEECPTLELRKGEVLEKGDEFVSSLNEDPYTWMETRQVGDVIGKQTPMGHPYRRKVAPRYHSLPKASRKAVLEEVDENGIYIFTMSKKVLSTEGNTWKYASTDLRSSIGTLFYPYLYEYKPETPGRVGGGIWGVDSKQGKHTNKVGLEVGDTLNLLANELGWNKVLIKFV